jgi:hypothetical protein
MQLTPLAPSLQLIFDDISSKCRALLSTIGRLALFICPFSLALSASYRLSVLAYRHRIIIIIILSFRLLSLLTGICETKTLKHEMQIKVFLKYI